jgi:hypothetical protein
MRGAENHRLVKLDAHDFYRQLLRTRCGSAWRLEHVARIIRQGTGPY